jgi:hypothetical protein
MDWLCGLSGGCAYGVATRFLWPNVEGLNGATHLEAPRGIPARLSADEFRRPAGLWCALRHFGLIATIDMLPLAGRPVPPGRPSVIVVGGLERPAP